MVKKVLKFGGTSVGTTEESNMWQKLLKKSDLLETKLSQ